ncbi:MAG TPA: aldehyde dehydrogenase family protein [Micropepsaceae bacterium]|nr:aldehyde dehydrogenase family protein [Micropepsaceae bacterium]
MPATVLRNEWKPVHARMLIGGEWTNSSQRIDVFNPARPDELVGTVPRGTPDDVVSAITAAKLAQPDWAAKSFAERARIIAPVLDTLSQDIEDRVIQFVRENGKTSAEARGEIAGVPARQRFTLELAAELDQRNEVASPNGLSFVGYLPYGVVVSIVPWNAPVSLAFLQIVPALLAGNTIVLKPPETCPLSLIRSVEMIAPLLPAGVINVVTGMPGEIGDTLTTHPDAGKLAFTGSVQAARKIMANAAETIKGITLELGGNDAAVLLEDADLGDAAMERMAKSVYRMTGQVCMAIKRIYVPESIKDNFLTAFARAVDRIVVGDGLDPAVTMGPMHTGRALERAQGIVADAARRGATVQVLGQVANKAVFQCGHFMQPTVVSEIAEDSRLMAEEQFCPAVPVAAYRDVDDAVARANATIYGFGGSIWTRDIARGTELARKLQAGTVFVNAHGTESVNRKLPYGGIKQSGIGRRAGIEGVREYMQIQTLTTFEG